MLKSLVIQVVSPASSDASEDEKEDVAQEGQGDGAALAKEDEEDDVAQAKEDDFLADPAFEAELQQALYEGDKALRWRMPSATRSDSMRRVWELRKQKARG